MLTLYYKPTCPYSERVICTAEALGLKFDLRDISSNEVLRNELIEKGGKKQVPYFEDTDRGVAMYDSRDIIEYLSEQYGTNAAEGIRIHRSDAACDACE